MNFSQSSKNVVDNATIGSLAPGTLKELVKHKTPNLVAATRLLELDGKKVDQFLIEELEEVSSDPLKSMINGLLKKMKSKKLNSFHLELTLKTKKALKDIVEKTESKEIPNLSGFVRADQVGQVKPENIFYLSGPIGVFLGNIQQYRCAMVLKGNRGSGKTTFAMQLANAFINADKTVGFFSLEQGGLESKDTAGLINRYISPENRKMMAVCGEVETGKEFETIKSFASRFDVIILDSWQKIKLKSTEFDRLRTEHSSTIWIVIFQLNAAGGTRGGNAPEFDANIVLNTVVPDPGDFSKNYVVAEKNRGNSTQDEYIIVNREIKPKIIK
jgi:nucleoside-triphosphatase THEP1